MTQFLNNIWTFLNTENAELVSLLVIPLYPLETFLLMKLFLTLFSIKANKKQKLLYVLYNSFIGIINSHFVPLPFNVFINYLSVFILIKIIFKFDLLKTAISLILSTFIFGLCNVLVLNPYLTILHISKDTFMITPIYRILYLLILYSFIFIVCIFLKKFKMLKFSLDLIDSLDKKTKIILLINLVTGFLTLSIQLIISVFYIDIVPLIITLLSFMLLVIFLVLSIYSFSRIVKLAIAKRNLQSAEDYNKSLEQLYGKVKGFKHDFESMVFTLGGYLDNNDLDGAKTYFADMKKDCKFTTNLSVLNPRIINNPGIYSLLNNLYTKAVKQDIDMDIKSFLDLSDLKINTYEFSRILGILIDNAIEASAICDDKIVKVIFRREPAHNKSIVIIENTYSNKDVDLTEIFKKGFSEKSEHSGIGLWEVQKYVSKTQNLNLVTTKNNRFFTQKLEIYDEIKNLF